MRMGMGMGMRMGMRRVDNHLVFSQTRLFFLLMCYLDRLKRVLLSVYKG
jgi:hypothetical protein